MKKTFLFSFFIVSLLFSRQNVNAQITFEHSYPNAQTNLYMVNLEVEGYKYVHRNIPGAQLTFYNLDHSLFTTINYPFTAPNAYFYPAVLYISEHLFDTDDGIEFMYVFFDEPSFLYTTRIIDQSGQVIFEKDSAAPIVRVNVPQEQRPIYNTVNGTKMILSIYGISGNIPTRADVYGLAGTLASSIEPDIFSDNTSELKSFPNPNDGNSTIAFKLPHGIHSGEIVLYNMEGMEIKRYRVDSRFGNLVLSNSGLSSGTYLYQLIAGNKAIDAKKMIVIR